MKRIDDLLKAMIDKVWKAYMALKFSAGQSVESATSEYRNELALVMLEYLESDRPVTAFRNQFRRATNDAMNVAMEAGWADGKGSGEIPAELQNWVNTQIVTQVGYIDGVFGELKELRKKGEPEEYGAFVGSRADGYAGTLTGVYAYAKMKADKFGLGVWKVGPTEHCKTCLGLEGQVRKVAWFLERGFVPQQNGSPTLECGGWNCQCTIQDPETGKVLVP